MLRAFRSLTGKTKYGRKFYNYILCYLAIGLRGSKSYISKKDLPTVGVMGGILNSHRSRQATGGAANGSYINHDIIIPKETLSIIQSGISIRKPFHNFCQRNGII